MESFFQYQRIQKAVVAEVARGHKAYAYDGERGLSFSSNPVLTQTLADIPSTESSNPVPTLIVDWSGPDDQLNPANWSVPRKAFMTALVSLIAVSVTAASAIDACGIVQYTEEFKTSEVVASLTTGLFMIGFAFGSLVSGPFSEILGRNIVYVTTMLLYLIFIMAAALAPNLASHLIFRFLAGIFGSTPLTCSGGTVADLWNPVQKSYAFLIFAIPGFSGPIIGQLIGSFIPMTLGWRWLEWIMLIMGVEASALRRQTGEKRYRAPLEMRTDSLLRRLAIAVSRPFLWSYTEPIVILMSLYLTIIYIILFTFLEGYRFIFGATYGLSSGMTSIAWAGMLVGAFLVSLLAPLVYSWTRNEYSQTGQIRPEARLWYAMLGGAPAVPIGLFWMGWTTNPQISIWSPLVASALIGFGMTTIFISAYLYIIDSYSVYSPSALAFMSFTRYLVSGGVMIAGGTIYERYGVPYTLSVLGAISALMAVIPYLFYFYGPAIRRMSKHAAIQDGS
ncbi:hypothetical protein AARAC_009871 [Aspergillus arachidicola]|uniref:Major facilitator superfamily (MFS) profile domain-containing protein n=1 Tax=Aspergillus arachidicola TaxID=656916 RepID=A0A2G7G9F4_9EURO|nr:hypothetical protein AARAC_009871 [Aspergillus arachidicola]